MTCRMRLTASALTPNIAVHQNERAEIAVVDLLKACASEKDLFKGRKLHADVLKCGLLQTNIFIGNTLLNFYAKCGNVTKARQVFDDLLFRDLVSWNVLVAGYVQHGLGMETLNCFKRMQQDGLAPDIVTFTSMLKACGSIGAVEKGEEIHSEIVREGLQGNVAMIGSALVDMYTKCGTLTKAQQIFEDLPIKNVISWTALIGGFCQQGHGRIALAFFDRMKCEGLSPDAVTFACILKACGSTGSFEMAEEMHNEILESGLLTGSAMLGNALVDMYVKLGALSKAKNVFDELKVQDVVSWTTLIGGYSDYGRSEAALECFAGMLQKNLTPNSVTYACVLKACSGTGELKKGTEIHAELARKGFSKNDTMLGNALLDMYTKCGMLHMAQRVFNDLPVRDVISWNTLITGYCERGFCDEALNCYEQMKCKGFSPDTVTYACALKACGNIGAADKGEEIHSEMAGNKLLENDILLGNALVGMYAKCGALAKAKGVFDGLREQDVVSWTALIAGYCEHGYAGEALTCFEEMKQRGPSPNSITFVCVLKACGSNGDVQKGQMYFDSMISKHGLEPNIEHYTCMVALFGRAGSFDKAMATLEKMPSSDYLPAWFALLGACQIWGNVKLGRFAFNRAICLDKRSAVAYVCMIRIYNAAGMQDDAREIEALRLKNKAWMTKDADLWIGHRAPSRSALRTRPHTNIGNAMEACQL